MPYSGIAELPPAVRQRYSSRCQRAFLGVFNAVYGSHGEEAAFRIAHATANACRRRRVAEAQRARARKIAEVVLNEATDLRLAAIKQARRIEQGVFNLTTAELRTLKAELEAARLATIGKMSQATADWDIAMQKGVLAELNAALARVESQAAGSLSSTLERAWAEGDGLLPATLERAGMTMTALPRIDPRMLNVGIATVPELISGVTDEIRRKVAAELRQAALGQIGPLDLIKRLGTLTGKGVWASAFARGEAIYRTEAGRMFQTANYTRMAELPDDEGWLKEWVSSEDIRVRRDHVLANGQRVKPDEMFTVGSEQALYPLDPNLSARQSIHCRCMSVPWHPDFEAEPDPNAPEPWRPLSDQQIETLIDRWMAGEPSIEERYGLLTAGQLSRGHIAAVVEGLEAIGRRFPEAARGHAYLKEIYTGTGPVRNAAGWMSDTGRLGLSSEAQRTSAGTIVHEVGHALMNLLGGPRYRGSGMMPTPLMTADQAGEMWSLWRTIRSKLSFSKAFEKYSLNIRLHSGQIALYERALVDALAARDAEPVGSTFHFAHEQRVLLYEQRLRAYRAALDRLQAAAPRTTKLRTDAAPSTYGMTDEFEDFAESFQRYILDPDEFAKTSPLRYAFIEKWVGKYLTERSG